MFELITSYLHTSWWTVGPRMARMGEARSASGHLCAVNRQLRIGAGNGESDSLIKTKHCDALTRCWRSVTYAQCSECECDETQPSTGKGLALRVGHRGHYPDV